MFSLLLRNLDFYLSSLGLLLESWGSLYTLDKQDLEIATLIMQSSIGITTLNSIARVPQFHTFMCHLEFSPPMSPFIDSVQTEEELRWSQHNLSLVAAAALSAIFCLYAIDHTEYIIMS